MVWLFLSELLPSPPLRGTDRAPSFAYLYYLALSFSAPPQAGTCQQTKPGGKGNTKLFRKTNPSQAPERPRATRDPGPSAPRPGRVMPTLTPRPLAPALGPQLRDPGPAPSRAAPGPQPRGPPPSTPSLAAPGPSATWGSTLVADMLHEQPGAARGRGARSLGPPREAGPVTALSRSRARRLLPGPGRAAAAAAGCADSSRGAAQGGEPDRTHGRGADSNGDGGDGGDDAAERQRARGRPGVPTSIHALRLRAAALQDRSRAPVPVSL